MNLRTKQLLVTLFFVGLFATVATAEEAAKKTWTVAKDKWIKEFSVAFPVTICKSNEYFCQCFAVTQAECEETAISATRVCINEYKDKIPEVLNQPEDGRYWGELIGQCAGRAYETTLSNKRNSNEKCNNQENWFREYRK